jgi:hypothetical protein
MQHNADKSSLPLISKYHKLNLTLLRAVKNRPFLLPKTLPAFPVAKFKRWRLEDVKTLQPNY